MFLKRVVLHGFKSFADRTEFEFGHGMTVIVGPNGCGKSNVVDAVKWVLGEQSAKSLRGNKMADVIFSGSRSRKPAQVSEVQLTFDNADRALASDLSEVTVGRQLFRSGISEYMLNGQPCRLKDIRELFLDTGVGVDAYSFIEQGRVDVLLQANPQERREIFEEAAGISKYKVRRAEAQRKLERAKQNLLRLHDLIEEVEKQLRSVRLAAGKARNYLQYDARLRELRSSFSLAEYHRLEESLTDLRARATGFEIELSARRTELAGRDAEGGELQQQLSRLDEEIGSAEAELLGLQSELSTLIERVTQGRTRLTEYGEALVRQKLRESETHGQVEGALRRVDADRAALDALRDEERQCEAALGAVRSRHEQAAARRDEARHEVERARHAAFDAARRESLIQNDLANLDQHKRRIETQLRGLHERRAQLEADEKRATSECAAAETECASCDALLGELRERHRLAEAELTALEANRRRIEAEIAQVREARSAGQSRLSLLEDMERRNEGVSDSARDVLSWRDASAGSGIAGLAADLLRIDHPDVGILEPILSRFENAIVVENTYAFLAESARRPALSSAVDVLALDRLPGGVTSHDYRGAPGVIAVARDWVTCDKRYEGLADALLGRVVVVDSLERAMAMSGSAPPGFVFVARDGQSFDSDGRVRIGPRSEAPGLIGRKSEIRQLRSELDDIESRLSALERERASAAASAADSDLVRRELLDRIAESQRTQGHAQSRLARLNDELTRIRQAAALAGGEVESVERTLSEAQRQAEQLTLEHAHLGATHRGHASRVEAAIAATAEAEREAAAAAEALTAARVEAGRLTEKRAAAEAAFTRLEAEIELIREQQRAASGEVESLTDRIARLETEIEHSVQRQKALIVDCDARRDRLAEQRDDRLRLKGRIDHCASEGREIQAQITELDAALSQIRVESREVEVRVEALVQRVRDELGTDLGELYKSYSHTDQDWEAVRVEIESLRQKIERLGNVNLDAITELEQLTPRYENLVAQRADLQTSAGRLETLIEELNRESRERFLTTFERIRQYFQELFRKLFGGGKADIILENPEDPLECGVEIIARPPGKEPQSISLLSGGEKTMAAVALMLAVFKSHPSPFVLMDEVDAALDEANNDRFNNVIQEFMAQSQFIIISHSKVTMHAADAMYGVTMEEAGVSKRVSVRFNERVQTPVEA